MTPGHSSIPPKETAIGVLAKAVAALEGNPHPTMFGQGPEKDFFSYMAPSVSFNLLNLFGLYILINLHLYPGKLWTQPNLF